MLKRLSAIVLILGVLAMMAIVLPFMAHAACTQETGGSLTSSLVWTNADTTDPVSILRSTTSGGPYTKVGSVPAGILAYSETVPQPTANITYYYVIENVSAAAGPSPNSNEVCKSFFPVPPAPAALNIQ